MLIYGDNQIEFFSMNLESILHTVSNPVRLKFKTRQAADDSSISSEMLELEHSQKQEVLRDITHKISREDIETLDKFNAFEKEKISKVVVDESIKGFARVYFFTDKNYLYLYQLAHNSSRTKSQLTLEKLCST